MKIKEFLKIQIKKPILNDLESTCELKKFSINNKIEFCKSRMNAIMLLVESNKISEAFIINKLLLIDLTNLLNMLDDYGQITDFDQIIGSVKKISDSNISNHFFNNENVLNIFKQEKINKKQIKDLLNFTSLYLYKIEKKAKNILKKELRTSLNDYKIKLYIQIPVILVIVAGLIFLSMKIYGHFQYRSYISKYNKLPVYSEFKIGRYIRDWLILGKIPFNYNLSFDKDFFEDHGGEDKILPRDGMVLPLENKKSIKWIKYRSHLDLINFNKVFEPSNNVVGYAFTTIDSPAEQRAVLAIGSDDGIKLWLNGKLVHIKNKIRASKRDNDKVEVKLRKGKNTILIKLTQKKKNWSFYLRILNKK